MFLPKKLTRLLSLQIMIKECSQLVWQKHYLYGIIKNLASGKEDIKGSNILKRYKKRLTLMML